MSQDVYIFEVNDRNFPSVVIENSHKIPVVVEFMGVWSEHCFVVAEIFSGLAKEFPERFVFAKVDIDESPELRKVYQIENVPTTVIIKNGEIVRADMGQLQEDECRAMLREQGIGHESDDLREQAREKHMAGDTSAAIMLLSKAMKMHPSNLRVAMDMVQVFVDLGEVEQASALLAKLPEKEQASEKGKALKAQMVYAKFAAETEGLEALQSKVMTEPDDHKARFDLSVCLVAKYEYEQAMDHLLMIVEREADFQEGAAREMLITTIRMIKPANPELANEYQRKLNSILAS
jgi:putative thioredoxin